MATKILLNFVLPPISTQAVRGCMTQNMLLREAILNHSRGAPQKYKPVISSSSLHLLKMI